MLFISPAKKVFYCSIQELNIVNRVYKDILIVSFSSWFMFLYIFRNYSVSVSNIVIVMSAHLTRMTLSSEISLNEYTYSCVMYLTLSKFYHK